MHNKEITSVIQFGVFTLAAYSVLSTREQFLYTVVCHFAWFQIMWPLNKDRYDSIFYVNYKIISTATPSIKNEVGEIKFVEVNPCLLYTSRCV